MASRYFQGAGEAPLIPHHATPNKEVGDLRLDVESGFQRVQDELDTAGVSPTPTAKFTAEGGLAVQLINKTGAVSVKGTVVETSPTDDNAVGLEEADGLDPIGVIYEDGVVDGDPVWVVVSGVAEVLLEDGTASTRNYWVRTSTSVAGRADATNAGPPGGTVAALETHAKEIGHCLESKTSGSDVLAKCVLHFN